MSGGTSRRHFLGRSLSAIWATSCAAPAAMQGDRFVWPGCGEGVIDPFARGIFLGVVPFSGEPQRTFGVRTGEGWDGRRLYDLQRIEQDGTITPTELFYIRTHHPDQLTTRPEDWVIRIRGWVEEAHDLPLEQLQALATDQGEVLLECSGNTDSGSFGLMSAASFSGVPVLEVLERFAGATPEAVGVRISGFDEHSVPSNNGHSTPGAAWVFSLEQLQQTGAFLALGMGGGPLPGDHGAPVRLVVPRWYGCACIKWVDEITLIGEDEPATSQMVEFARRTHQDGAPQLALDYAPAAIQQAAMPVRIERWMIDGRIAYRILGILWGGEAPSDRLVIRIDGQEAPVSVCPEPASGDTWSLWVHRYDPAQPGEVLITTRIDDPDVPQIRLDQGWYDRTFVVEPF